MTTRTTKTMTGYIPDMTSSFIFDGFSWVLPDFPDSPHGSPEFWPRGYGNVADCVQYSPQVPETTASSRI